MLAVKSMDLRDNFKALCDKVFDGETLIISRPKNENVVLLSEREYNEMLKAKRNADYLSMIVIPVIINSSLNTFSFFCQKTCKQTVTVSPNHNGLI